MLLLVALAIPASADDLLYTVRPGDNLWNLAKHHLKHLDYYRRLQAYNHIQDPRHIKPGSTLKIPIEWLIRSPSPAQVIRIRGDVELIHASGEQTRPQPGDQLTTGDLLRTGPDGSANIRMADGSQLIVQANTEIRMDTLSSYGINGMVDTRMRMQRGRIDTRVPPRTPPSRYEITTPAAVAAVRGTSFRVSADADAPKARTEVLKGTVGVSAAAVNRDVPQGFGTLAEAGKPPLEPRPLLPAPGIAELEAPIRYWPIKLQWKPVPKAVAYRVQVSDAPAFDSILIDRHQPQPAFELPRLADGKYHIRARAIDDLGLEGIDSVHALTIDAEPLPPRLLQPPPDARLHDAKPQFSWEASRTAAYRLEVARDEAFTEILLTIDNEEGTSAQPGDDLSPGRYHWRVASLDKEGEQGPHSPSRSFSIRPLPSPPGSIETRGMENGVRIEWPAVNGAVRYRVQLARDPAFEEILSETTSTATHVEQPTLPAGTLYVRVRSIDADGVAGPFGETRSVVLPSGFRWPAALLVIIPLLL